MIKKDSSLVLARQRQVALWKSLGKYEKAVACLCSYLEDYPADVVSWRELAEMYAYLGRFQQAVFCMEHVLLVYPRNALVQCRLAEFLFSVHTPESIASARKYFCLSAEGTIAAGNTSLLKPFLGILSCINVVKENNAKEKGISQQLLQLEKVTLNHIKSACNPALFSSISD